jgi:hypothetical protein
VGFYDSLSIFAASLFACMVTSIAYLLYRFTTIGHHRNLDPMAKPVTRNEGKD